MTNGTLARGYFAGVAHHFATRVYFEDTDLSGIVYHANYLRYMERARSDMLLAIGIDQRGAFERGEGVYAVADLAIRYRRPAKLDDDLTIVSTLAGLRAAAATIHQTVMRDTQILAEARVTAAFLTPAGRPRRQPKDWVIAFQTLKEDHQ